MLMNLASMIALRLFGPPALQAPVAARRTRAITFIEYAILAAIAVAIGFIFRTQLGSIFDTLLTRLRNAVNIN
jgi:hypothetical protein